MNITTASVVLSNTTRAFDKKYTYIIPEELSQRVSAGCRVLVPFGNGPLVKEGFIIEIRKENNSDSDIAYKEIKKILEPYPLIQEDNIRLLEWMKIQYICTYYDVIKCMLPPGTSVKAVKKVKLKTEPELIKTFKKAGLSKIVTQLSCTGGECEYEELKAACDIRGFKGCIDELCGCGAISVEETYEQKVNARTVKAVCFARPAEEILQELESNSIRKIQHIKVLEILLENEMVPAADIQRFAGVTASVLNTLCKYGYICYKNMEVNRDPLKDRQFERTQPLKPTDEQENALNILKNQLDSGCYAETLIHGITGSGKTEVYLQLISHCFEMGKKAILLVPEISLTPQMVERFVSRFGKRVAVIHSRLSLGERYDQWKLINDGSVDVVVGARSAVFAPMRDLGLVIIDEEHEGSYKSESLPRYNAKDVAQKRCEINQALLVYGSATPSVETYYRAVSGQITLIKMKNRPNTAVLPQVELVDMRLELENGNKTPFSVRLVEELEKNHGKKQQSILFLNRRGFSTFVMCRSCGFTMKCPECSVALTYHSKSDRLICHYCGFTVKNPARCPSCESNYIRYFGIGTQKIEEDIRQRMPDSSVIRMDIDTTGYKNAHEEILGKFRNENIEIMIGTQMIAKGHDFPNVTLVGILAADSLLNSGDFRASERTFQLLTQVSGRAGRGEAAGRVIVQTYNTEQYSILAACKHDFEDFYRQEILIREKLDYPPFTNVAVIVFTGRKDREVFELANSIKPVLINECPMEFNIFGPSRCTVPKVAKKYRWRIIIKARDKNTLVEKLTNLSDSLSKKVKAGDITVGIDINPYNML